MQFKYFATLVRAVVLWCKLARVGKGFSKNFLQNSYFRGKYTFAEIIPLKTIDPHSQGIFLFTTTLSFFVVVENQVQEKEYLVFEEKTRSMNKCFLLSGKHNFLLFFL